MRSVSPGLRLRSFDPITMRQLVRPLLRSLVGVCVAVFATVGYAQQVPEYAWKESDPRTWYSSTSAACGAFVAAQNAASSGQFDPRYSLNGVVGASPNFQCDVKITGYDGTVVNPHNYTSLFMRMVDPPPPLNEACLGTEAAGKTVIKNWTVGYGRTPDDNDTALVGPVNKLPGAGKDVCAPSGCKMTQQDPDAAGWKAWISQTPTAQGLYRRSLDVPFTSTGQTCTPGAAGTGPMDSTVTDPTCPGVVTDINGKKYCGGTAQQPITPQNTPLPETPRAANPPAGNVTNPDATGTARTPSAGTGGAAGGPAGAAVGGVGGSGGGASSGTGTRTTASVGSGNVQVECGAPGQPVCNVKVDEAGTPSSGDFTKAGEALNTWGETVGQKINDVHGMTAPEWSFAFQFPTGCAALDLGSFKGTTFSFNPCQHQDKIHDLLSMVWAAVTAFCVIGMVGRAIRES